MKNNKIVQVSLCLGLSLGTSVFSSQLAFAEGNNDSLFDMSIEDLMNLKVTVASLFEESELDAASSVSLLQASDWEKTGARRISDALESVPSVASYPTWGGAEAIAIRGYATELSVRGIANTLDGVPLNTYTYATSLYDKPIINLAHLDRVEMIRGPGSTLYGTDAFHGVMSHQLKHAKVDTVEVSGTTGSSEYENASIFMAQRNGDAIYNAGFAVAKQGEQDLAYTYTSPADGLSYSAERDYEYKDLSGFLTASFGDEEREHLKLTGYVNDFQSSEFPGIGTQFFARLPTIFDIESTSIPEDKDHSGQISNFWLVSLDASSNLNNQYKLETKLYHWKSKQEWIYDNSRYPASLSLNGSGFPLPCRNATNGSPNPIYCSHTLFQSADEHRSGAHFYLKSMQESYNTQWALGFGRDRLKIDSSNFIRVALDGSTLINQTNPSVGKERNVTFALLQARTSFADGKAQIVYGIRADNYSDLDAHHSPRLGAIFKITDNYTSKILYGHAFRAPTSIERFGSVQGVEANPDIQPEEIDTIEWVHVFYDKDYSVEATVFKSEWEDGIVLVPSTGVLNKYVNTGQNRSYGLEVSGRKQFNQLTFQGSGSYIRSKNIDSNNSYLAFPEWLFTLQGNYLIPQNDIELVLKQRVMLDQAEGDYLGTIEPKEADDYFRTDFSVIKTLRNTGLSGDQSVFLHVRNLFDQRNDIPSLYNAEGGLEDYGLGVNIGLKLSW